MPTKKTAFIMASLIFAIGAIASANFASAVEWTPLVRIPGLPPTGTVNLSMYLIGLYNFLLSIVGIVAVIMLIIGGMRYITAVGNPSAIGDAKDIITNAIIGLILALLSWVFISTINPDVLYIKQPGSAGVSDPATGAQNLGDLAVTTSPSPCIANGASNSPMTINTGSILVPIKVTGCPCIDKTFVPAPSGSNCQNICLPNNCLVADLKVGLDQNNTGLPEVEIARRYAIYDSPEESPVTFADGARLILYAGNSISGNPINWWRYEISGEDSTFTPPPFALPGGADPWYWVIADYSYYVGLPGCVETPGIPGFITCPLILQVEDNTGNTSEDRVFIRILKP